MWALLSGLALAWVVEATPVAQRPVRKLYGQAFPSFQVAVDAGGSYWVVFEALEADDANPLRTNLRGRRWNPASGFQPTVSLSDEDLDTTDDDDPLVAMPFPALHPSMAFDESLYHVSYTRRTRTVCGTGCGLGLVHYVYTSAFLPVLPTPLNPLAGLVSCQRTGLAQLLAEDVVPVRHLATWVRQGMLPSCNDPEPKDPAWEAIDDLLANWTDAEAGYPPSNRFDVANDPTGVPAAEHHVSGVFVGGQVRSLAQVYDEWHTSPHSVGFVGWTRNPAGPPEYVDQGRKNVSAGDAICAAGECEARNGTLDGLDPDVGVYAAWLEEWPGGATVLLHRRCQSQTADCAADPLAWSPDIGDDAEVVVNDGNKVANPEIAVVPSRNAAGVLHPSVYVMYETVVGGQRKVAISSRTCLGAPTDSMTSGRWFRTRTGGPAS